MSNYLPTIFGENMMDVFDLFDRGLSRGLRDVDRALYGRNAERLMKTDIHEKDDGYDICVDLPGFKKDELKVELNNGYLTISAEKSLNKDDENHGKLIRQERYSGSMQRSFYVGSALTEEDIHCAYENGVLKVSLPKKDARKVPEKKTIMIEG